ncbi:HNH endonuclease [bacterium]|nr:HNH endonuclease [bacterium]
MSEFVPNLPAAAVDAHLRAAVAELRRAEQNAVLWFAELMRRRLYRDCGYASIHAYADAVLGFGQAKTYQFIKLAESLSELPQLRASVEAGEMPWTKARSVAAVATPRSEGQWIALAKASSARELEAKIRESRSEAANESGQGALLPPAPAPLPTPAPKVQLSFTLEPEQHARWLAIVERLRKQGHARPKEELLLAAFAALAEAECTRVQNEAECTRVQNAPPYQVVIYRCEDCGAARLPDGRSLTPAMAAQAACDCRTQREGEPNRASIPPALRRQVLARDGHRCQAPGCRGTRFLEVHHREPRRRGGRNSAENLITLCAACHRLLHEGSLRLPVGRPATTLPAAALPAAAWSDTG